MASFASPVPSPPGAQPQQASPGAPPAGLSGLVSGGGNAQPVGPTPAEKTQSYMEQIRGLHMEIDALATQHPEAANDLNDAKNALTNSMIRWHPRRIPRIKLLNRRRSNMPGPVSSHNPNEALAQAVTNHQNYLAEHASIQGRAKQATEKPSPFTASHGDYLAQNVKDVQAQNKMLTKLSQVKGSGGSPLATTMSPVVGPKPKPFNQASPLSKGK